MHARIKSWILFLPKPGQHALGRNRRSKLNKTGQPDVTGPEAPKRIASDPDQDRIDRGSGVKRRDRDREWRYDLTEPNPTDRPVLSQNRGRHVTFQTIWTGRTYVEFPRTYIHQSFSAMALRRITLSLSKSRLVPSYAEMCVPANCTQFLNLVSPH